MFERDILKTGIAILWWMDEKEKASRNCTRRLFEENQYD